MYTTAMVHKDFATTEPRTYPTTEPCTMRSPLVVTAPAHSPQQSGRNMYFVYGCPKVLTLRPEPKPGEEILAVSFNPSGSLLAIASTSRLCVWSGGKDHVPLGALALSLRGLSGTSLLWKRDSGLLAAVSSAGKLVLVSVKRKAGATPASERFAMPDWFEPQVRVASTGWVMR